MNDDTEIRRYYETRIEETKDLAPPAGRIKSIADSVAFRPVSKWETLFGLMVTFGYLAYFFNPMHWFSLGRSMLAFVNGISLSRFVFVFNIGL
jgi:hypothetical protein